MNTENTDVAYMKAREIASHGDIEARRQLAEDKSAPLEILYFLATDEEPWVRKAVAANPAAPVQADFLLSNDTDAETRTNLASKIGRQLGDLDQDTDSGTYTKVHKVLENLVNDQLHMVRSIIADEVKRLKNVPAGLVSKLARDAETSVSIPVLEHSPLLEDTELLNIIAEGVQDDAITAIARREHVGGDVSQSIAGTGNVEAIGALLENKTAEIVPETMEHITDIASENEALHKPMAARDDLPTPVLRRMATFVATSIVEDLISRYPLTSENQDQLRSAVSARIAAADAEAIVNVRARSDHYRILIAEDEPIMRSMIKEIISSFASADITEVDDGEKALSLVEQGFKYDLIVSDWMMPNMTGISLLRTLRGRGDNTPFAMLTSRNDVDSIVAAQNDGVDAFITKPVTTDDIQRKIQVLLR
jgi:CheY-like chemotaxis protein